MTVRIAAGMAMSVQRRLQRYLNRYLERYYTSRGHLRILALRHLRKRQEGEEVEGEVLIDSLLDRLEANGILNDARYATDKARSLYNRGASPRMISAKLYEKRLSQDHIREAIAALGADAAIEAARNYARKKRLGEWGLRSDDREQRRKDLARLARRGFSYDIARAALEK